MHKFNPGQQLLRLILFILTILGISHFLGCAPTNMPSYKRNVIARLPRSQPEPLWIYPELSFLKSADPSKGLTGITKTGELPYYLSFMQNVEPPFLVGMHLLSDGSLLCISPLKMEREYQRFVFANYCREVFTRVKIILIDTESGREKWSTILDAKGLFEIREINSTLLFHSKSFDQKGKFTKGRLVGLQKDTGQILWQRIFTKPFVYFSIADEHNLAIYSFDTDQGSDKSRTVEGIHLPTGQTKLKLSIKESDQADKQMIIWPILFPHGILLFDDGLTFYELPQLKVKWTKKEFELRGSAQPEATDHIVYFQTKDGLVALNIETGKILWTSSDVKTKITKIIHTGKYLCVTESEKGWFSKKHNLILVNPENGTVVWRYKTDPILGNLVEATDFIFFTTKDRGIALDFSTGSERFTVKLPWDDEFSSHTVSLRNRALMVINEWNAASWSAVNGELIYHHHFAPLCAIMTTKERMLEQKALGRSVTAMTVNTFSYTSPVKASTYTSKFYSAMANYRKTGDTLYLNQAQFNYGMSRCAFGMERMNASMQFGQSVTNATLSVGWSILQRRVIAANSLVYPAIDAVLKNHRGFDNTDYAARLVQVQEGKQHFSAIEVLNLNTGNSKRLLLSPYQLPSNLKTLATSPFTATELHGYLPISVYISHNFLTCVDLRHKRVYHYGPGLNPNEYVTFGKKGFIRGRLIALPLNLPI